VASRWWNFLKISSFVSTEYTNVTDGWTDTKRRHKSRLCIVSRAENWRNTLECHRHKLQLIQWIHECWHISSWLSLRPYLVRRLSTLTSVNRSPLNYWYSLSECLSIKCVVIACSAVSLAGRKPLTTFHNRTRSLCVLDFVNRCKQET